MVTKKGRKITGGKYHAQRKKRLSELAGKPRVVRLGPEKKKFIRGRGGKLRVVLLSCNKANVTDPKTNTTKVMTIKNVLEVPSNPFLAKRNVLVKGAIILTEAGKARITNRPSQEGSINAVLLKE